MSDSTSTAKSSLKVTAIWLGLLTILIAGFWFVVFVYMPIQKKKFDEYALQLPSMSRTAIDVAMFLNGAWFVVLPVMLLVVLGGVVILRHGLDAAKGGILYAMLMAVLLTGISGFLVVNMVIPLFKLAEALSK